MTENGPFLMPSGIKLPIYNKNGWNNFANLLYVDQPAGTGYSYAEIEIGTQNTEDIVSNQLIVFLEQFYQKYPKYARLSLFIFGESYAGHYVPVFSTKIIKDSPILRHNLKGISIGNGWVEPIHQYPSCADFMYQIGYISEEKYIELRGWNDDCLEKIKDNSEITFTICQKYVTLVLFSSEEHENRTINPFYYKSICENMTTYCYDGSNVHTFLNDPKIKATLGVNRTWVYCNSEVFRYFTFDMNKGYAKDVAFSLENNVRVLVYTGKDDFVCNYIGTRAWTNQMDWSGKKYFGQQTFRDWVLNGKTVGSIKIYGRLTYLEIEDAGHMAPTNQPEVSQEMVRSFLNNEKFGD